MTRIDKAIHGLSASHGLMMAGSTIIIVSHLGMTIIHIIGRARINAIDDAWWIGSNLTAAALLIGAIGLGMPKLATFASALSSGIWVTWGVLAYIRAQGKQPPGYLDPAFASMVIGAWALVMAAAWSGVRGSHDTAATDRTPASLRGIIVDRAGDVGAADPSPPAGDPATQSRPAIRD